MGKANREMYYKQFDKHYKNHRSLGKGKCLYCGGPEEHLDHVPALSWVSTGSSLLPQEFLRVPACAECNLKLNAKPLHTIHQRFCFLSSSYYEEFKSLPELGAGDLEGIGETLFRRRAALMLRKADLGERLRWMGRKAEEELLRGLRRKN